jgi:hypothetical protein
MRTALAQGLKAKDIVNFIKTSGGVQEIKLARSGDLFSLQVAIEVLV